MTTLNIKNTDNCKEEDSFAARKPPVPKRKQPVPPSFQKTENKYVPSSRKRLRAERWVSPCCGGGGDNPTTEKED
jgi:hypothetical protein